MRTPYLAPQLVSEDAMNRRQFLHAASMAASGVVAGCYRSRPRAANPVSGINCNLAPVLVSPDREIRTVVGLRPYRPSGFVVKAEKLGEKLVIHNYGHGGAGITLSWGTSQLATALLPGMPVSSVAVLGCGAVGLATARLLQDRGLPVTIYASELPPNTTSNIAGGSWFPFGVFDFRKQSPEFMNQFLQATELSYRRYQTLLGPRYGVRWLRNYFLSHQAPSDDSLGATIRPFLPELRDLSESEHPFSGYQFVRQYDSMLIEPPIYLNAMLTDFRIAGGAVRVVHFDNVSQLQQLAEPVIFNCTGLGARELFDDQELTPAKGQLTVLLPQPEVNYMAVMEDGLYMFPRTDGILLGGTFEKGEWSLSVNETAKAHVLKGHAQFFGSFRVCHRAALDFQRRRVLGTSQSHIVV
jgi:glycine/D-amino acid oxidase-like deaminating enzyme